MGPGAPVVSLMNGTDELDPGRLQILPCLGHIVDQETGNGACIEVFVPLVAGTEHRDLVTVGQ